MRHEEHWFGAQPGKQRMIIIVINMINISFCSMSKGICVVARRNVIVYCPGHRYLKSFLVSLRSHRRRRCKAPVTTHYSRLWLIIEFEYLRALFVSRIITTNPWPPHELPNTDSPQTHPTPCPSTSLQLDIHIRLVSIQALTHLTSTQHREPPHLHTTHPDSWDFDMYSHPFINKTGSATLSRRGQPNFYCSHRHYQDERFHGSHLQCQDEASHPFIDKPWCDFDMHHRHMGFLYTAGTWDFDKHSRRIYNYQHMMDIIHNDSWHSSHTHMPLKPQLVLIGSAYPFSHSFGIATFTGGPFYFLMWRGWLLTCIFLNVLKYIWVR